MYVTTIRIEGQRQPTISSYNHDDFLGKIKHEIASLEQQINRIRRYRIWPLLLTIICSGAAISESHSPTTELLVSPVLLMFFWVAMEALSFCYCRSGTTTLLQHKRHCLEQWENELIRHDALEAV